MNHRLRSLMAGGPFLHAPDDPTGDSGSGGGDTDNPPREDGQTYFDKGYGQGVSKGERNVLKALGVESLDQAKALREQAAAAAEADRANKEKQGEFENLYKETSQKLESLQPEYDAYKKAFAAQMASLTEGFDDEQKTLLDGLPPDKQFALAKALAGDKKKQPVGGPPGGQNAKPGEDGKSRLEALQKKALQAGGLGGLSEEQRQEFYALQEEAMQNVTIEDVFGRAGR